MIPKTINYCWFGGKEKPESVKKCIESWKKYCPQYEIKEWNEDNFNLQCCDYVKEASIKQKWAFVSDYARFWILYNYGGIYLDTDVEIIKPLYGIISNGPFMGCEEVGKVNPGLGMAAEPKMKIFKEILDCYSMQHFLYKDGTENEETIVTKVTNVLVKYGLKDKNIIQKVSGLIIYPVDYFSPIDYRTKEERITMNTVMIHHYAASWHTKLDDIVISVEGNKFLRAFKIQRVIAFPLRVINKFKHNGVKNTLIFILKKL